MFNSHPKISIVTPSFNQAQYIEQTIESVISQNYPNLEYIIIDGGSTDNSVEIIKKYQQHLSYWVSEKDDGQANAINKGLKLCTGEIFNWLNSDDYLERGALFKIAEAFSDKNVNMVAGKVRNFSSTEEEYIQNQNLSAKGLMCWKPRVKFVQPGAWMRRECVEVCGGIEEQFHYAFDWDLYIRYLYLFPNVKEISELLVHFRIHEGSKTKSLLSRFAEEERIIIEKLYKLNEYQRIRESCLYKIQKSKWTTFLSELSNSDLTFIKKFVSVLKNMQAHNKVSVSRQTIGALKAYLFGKTF